MRYVTNELIQLEMAQGHLVLVVMVMMIEIQKTIIDIISNVDIENDEERKFFQCSLFCMK